MKILIIGGVAVGATAAARLNRLNKNANIIMFEKDEYISFANCGLPYYLSNTIQKRENLILQTKESFYKAYNVDVRIQSEVIKIDKENKKITVKNNEKTYEETYDYLILAPGSIPIKIDIKGAQDIYTLRNINDVDKIYAKIQNAKNALVIGGGFIGIEVAENLIEKGLNVTLINKTPRILNPYDDEMAKILENILIANKVNLINNTSVQEIKNKTVILENQQQIQSDINIMAIGVTPNTFLAKDANLEIGDFGGIKVNEYLQTSDQFIYAGGDCIEVNHFISKTKVKIPLAGPANRQGRLIADNINGLKKTYKGTLGSSVIKIFDYTAAATGMNALFLQENNIKYSEVHIHRSSHASYYPGSEILTMKLLFNEENGKIYGAQAIGKSGVEKRIDVIATAIKANLSVEDLHELELTYAPPYSSAKDPVNILGYVATNLMDTNYEVFKVQDVKKLILNGIKIIDVRTPDEFLSGSIENSINIPITSIKHDHLDFPDTTYYLTCHVGQRGYLAQRELSQKYPHKRFLNLSGGYKLYEEYIKNEEKK